MKIEVNNEDKFELRFDLIAVVVVAVIFCTMLPRWLKGDEERAVLSAAGYTEIQLDGFRFLECPDLFGMGFKAKGPTGATAKGAVCRGIFTSSSIRLKK